MRLFLLRHGEAKDIWPDDTRPLSVNGINQLDKLCGSINPEIFNNLAQIWHSPYLRATQSANHFKDRLNISAPLVESKGLLPCDNCLKMAKIIASISSMGADLMLVGHNPCMESLASTLINDSKNLCPVKFNTATFAYLELACPPSTINEFGIWELKSLIYPELFR